MELELDAQPDDAERRHASPRSKVMLSASLVTDNGTVSVKIRNISEFGALLEGYPLPARDKKVTLKRLSLAASARVAWSRGTCCGVEFDDPVVPATWLDSSSGARPPASAAQARVDAIQAEIRGGSPARSSEKPSQGEAPGQSGENDLDQRIAEELAHVQRILETIGDQLVNEPIMLHRHSAALQQFDLASKVLGHLARIMGAEDRAGAVKAVGMAELRARLTRRGL